MKRLVRVAVLALAAMAVASGAIGGGTEGSRVPGKRGNAPLADDVIGVMRSSDSTIVVVREGSTVGSFSTEEASKDRDNYTYLANVIANNAITSSARSDSMATPVDVHSYRNLGLFLYALGSGGTGSDSLMTAARIAVQVRGHGVAVADTASSFPWQTMTGANASGVIDSVGNILQEDATTAGNGEFVWVIKHPAGLPRGVYVPLYADGQPHPPYISIRIRLLSILTASANTRLRVRVSLVGSN